MSYCITKTYNNGYLCQCCRRTYTVGPDWVQDRAKALEECPTQITDRKNWTLEGVTVTDGSTGETIAEGEYDQRGRGKYERWFGHIDGKPFDHRIGPEGEPWED